MKELYRKIFLVISFISILSFVLPVNAQSLTDLQQQIDANKALLNKKAVEANSLQKQVDVFDAQIKDAELQISKTQIEVNQTQTEVVNLQNQIQQKETEIIKEKNNLNETVRAYYENSQSSTLEVVIGSNSLSDAIDRTQYLEAISSQLNDQVVKINKAKADLESKKTEQEKKKKQSEDLLFQQKDLKDSLDNQQTAKSQLLSQTKGQEAEYQKNLNAAWKEYEDALARSRQSNESNYIGGSGSGYFTNPNPSGRLTQGYGCTSYAQCGNPNGPYGGNIHNGLDIAAKYGSSIKAAADGIVLDRGEEYNSHGWGNWIIIRHSNGLATLYGHLSSFRVSVGQSVSKGDEIGLEGNTGNSTGPHLHFSVFTHLIIYNGAYHGPDYSGTVNPQQFL